MMALQPAHYALSEAVLALVTALAVWRLMPRHRMTAIALAPFGLAALIGTIRIAAGMTGPIIEVHQFVSRSGGAFGLAALVAVLAGLRDWRALAAGLIAAALALAVPAKAPLLFGGLILVGAVLAARRDRNHPLLAAAGFAVLLAAQLVNTALRAAQPGLAWHVFHVLVAVWVICVVWLFRPGIAKSV